LQEDFEAKEANHSFQAKKAKQAKP